MGCTESLPAMDAFEEKRNVDPKLTPLGANVPGASPSEQRSLQLLVAEKVFSWSGDNFSIKTSSGTPYHGLSIKGKTIAVRDRMTLLDEKDRPVAVCMRKFDYCRDVFKIYTREPLFPDQKPSNRMYDNDTRLYTYCEVERTPGSTIQNVKFDNDRSPSFTIHRVGNLWPKKRVVKYRGKTAALMKGGTFSGMANSYCLTINPGIDPLLIVCLCAICDEMDEDANMAGCCCALNIVGLVFQILSG